MREVKGRRPGELGLHRAAAGALAWDLKKDRCFRLTRLSVAHTLPLAPPTDPLKALSRGAACHSNPPGPGDWNGAVGENRTHDLSLTKGLRYHYATTATVVFRDLYKWRGLNGFCGLGPRVLKGALL